MWADLSVELRNRGTEEKGLSHFGCRWRWKKGPKQRWSGYFSLCPFPSWKGVFSQNGPQRSRARRCCAAKRTLHGEDRSEILDKRERDGPKWTAKMAQSLTASDTLRPLRAVDTRLSADCGSYPIPFPSRVAKSVRPPIPHNQYLPRQRYYYTYSTMHGQVHIFDPYRAL